MELAGEADVPLGTYRVVPVKGSTPGTPVVEDPGMYRLPPVNGSVPLALLAPTPFPGMYRDPPRK